MKPRALISWSSGKDCAWALHLLRQSGEIEIAALVTNFVETTARVAMHAVPMALVEAQAHAAGLPLWTVPLPWPCPNVHYEEQMRALVERARSEGITHMVFGDLFLADIRAYRERQLQGTGLTPLFPLWTTASATGDLARTMLASGLRAVLTVVDARRLGPEFAGREFDPTLLDDLPTGVDPCGELGEFHTFCHTGPLFDRPVPLRVGNRTHRDGFWYAAL